MIYVECSRISWYITLYSKDRISRTQIHGIQHLGRVLNHLQTATLVASTILSMAEVWCASLSLTLTTLTQAEQTGAVPTGADRCFQLTVTGVEISCFEAVSLHNLDGLEYEGFLSQPRACVVFLGYDCLCLY